MSNHCRSCGIEIPKGQKFCSVCYGDPYYGTDGYLLNMMNEEWEREAKRQEQERQYAEEQKHNGR